MKRKQKKKANLYKMMKNNSTISCTINHTCHIPATVSSVFTVLAYCVPVYWYAGYLVANYPNLTLRQPFPYTANYLAFYPI